MSKTDEVFQKFPEPADAQRQMVTRLKELVAEAEAGNIEGIVIVTERPGGSLLSYYGGTEKARVTPQIHHELQTILSVLGSGSPDAAAEYLEAGLARGSEALRRARGRKGN